MKTPSRKRTLAQLALTAGLLLGGLSQTPTAQALPPGGANSVDTPGTSSSVSPGTLQAGDTISFRVSGFPAGEQLYIKVDDGQACPSDAAQGACVVHQQKINSAGVAEGSFVLSKELAEGPHTLRFLATEIVYSSSGQQEGSRGFSNRSPQFTISGVNQNSSGGQVTNVDAATINQAQPGGNQPQTGGDQKQTQEEQLADQPQVAEAPRVEIVTENGQTLYRDAQGRTISKEEYEAALAASQQTSAQEEEPQTASSAPSQQAPAQASSASSPASEAQASEAAQTQASSQQQEAESSVPWLGLTALGASLLVALVVLIRRRAGA